MDRMILLLKPDASQEASLEALLAAQQDPQSPEYRRWLTPEEFGERFGVSESDINRLVAWLTSHGFQVEPTPASRKQIVFNGTAGQVRSAFHTEVRAYNTGTERHYANAQDPSIPAAFAAVVAGVVSLNDFQSRPMHRGTAAVGSQPEFTSGMSHYLSPSDFATIYDAAGLYTQSIDGTGQSVAVAGRSNLSLSDVQSFRSTFGLRSNNPAVIVNGTNPGVVSTDEETEATLDVEWSGATAPKASVQFVVSASTNTSDGITLSSQYIVNHNLAPVMTLSFGNCEAAIGSAGNQFWNSLWHQAAAQGITVLVAAGDSGAAGCDSPSSTSATGGAGVNGLCSSPYSTCVGGTQFADSANPSTY
jgi:subtilase family serine protease